MQTLDLITFRYLIAVAILAFTNFGCQNEPPETQKPAVKITMKEISYRNGLVTFSIPSHWKEEYDDQGGGVFYEDGQDTGTLRLNVLTFTNSNSAKPVDVNEHARNIAAKNEGEYFDLRPGDAMAKYDSQSVEDGESIKQRFWAIYSRVGDSHLRIAVFSYTQSSHRFNDIKHMRDLETLDREIRNARFAKEIGSLG